jgi:hypothetical protein
VGRVDLRASWRLDGARQGAGEQPRWWGLVDRGDGVKRGVAVGSGALA